MHIEIDCPNNATVALSEALFRQIIYNIVQNAIQASPPQGKVKIAAAVIDSRLDIHVSDEGSGIDEKIRDKIFEPFFTTGTGGPASGLAAILQTEWSCKRSDTASAAILRLLTVAPSCRSGRRG